MKQRNKEKRLRKKQEVYDKMIKEHPGWTSSYHRPGSVKKS
jgi:hypothetical protein